jgi:[NiFe] hydrogenase maturation protein HypF
MLTYNIRVYGIVQGVGFRPFVSRICKDNGIMGTVANKGSYVEIFAQGENVGVLFDALKHTPPDRAVILNTISHECEMEEYDTFEIIESEKDEGDIFVSPDIAICEECKRELYDSSNRRYMHPFINCTNCGPRLTILDSMPYDRVRTSMKDFKMCPECEYEYTHPETRRYDAQPVCCPNCGPSVYLIETGQGEITARGSEAITAARRSLTEGKIVAIKGIGGFHLACDAKNEEAVARLRQLKHRPMNPFAVMMKNMETVLRECNLKDEIFSSDSLETDVRYSEGSEVNSVRELLTGYQKPIILLEKKCSEKMLTQNSGCSLAESVAPDNPYVGVMLPYTPIHMLLFDYQDEYEVSDCLVMTSANASGAPICRTDEDALNEIAGFTDYILSNDRMIRTRADDSVTDFYKGRPYMIRRSRGFAPLPVMISNEDKGCVLAVGGELKNTFAIAKNSLIYPSAYVGDMEDIRTVNALEESIVRMETLLEAKPSLVVCDMHPKYNTTAVAESLGLPVMKVQHHYAHILSCMAENDYLDEVIGVSFDGTGYGTDGTIWGGEFLKCSINGFERLDHITSFIQCGGDLSSKEGWRIAASVLGHLQNENMVAETYNYEGLSKDKICNRLGLCSEMEFSLLENMAGAGVNSIASTSAGRLFDAVSAILGIRRSSTFEGEASTALMFEAERYLRKNNISVSGLYSSGFGREKSETGVDGYILDNTNNLAIEIADRYLKGEERGRLAFVFHIRLAEYIVETCRRLSAGTGLGTIALSGGVFQNKLLLSFVDEGLREAGLRVLRHSLIPPNDGGDRKSVV